MPGYLTTHVLDTAQGRPAAGVEIVLWRLEDAENRQYIARARTNADGRTDVPLIPQGQLAAATYELVFHVGVYFAGQPVAQTDPPFLDRVPVRFHVADPDAHYHVPLLVSPWAYSTYRGSLPMPPNEPLDTLDAAQRVLARCDQLATYSEEPDRLTRRYATPSMRQANEAVAGWMRAAGMATRQDAIGNLIGRYEAETPTAPTLLLGSHLDTVRDAGKYDGPLGVLVALASVERLHAQRRRLPFAVEVLAFADEEGLRCHTAYLGSSAVAGTFEPAWLALSDDDGIPLADAMRAFGGDPDAIASARWSGGDLLGYCEVHIEQGPILERENLPVGLVTGIQGQSRLSLTFTGEAGHAGTVPMALRRDALSAAAELVLVVERFARETADLVATIGQLAVAPGASNVIPGRATLTLDLRHPDDASRERALTALLARADEIAQGRGVSVTHHLAQDNAAVPCSPGLRERMAAAITASGYPVRELASGAGHDAVRMAHLTEVAMFFVRCAGGVSHSPAESVTAEDVAAAIAVLDRFIASLAEEDS